MKSVDSQETVGENSPGANAFDGSTSTIWHTKWLGGAAPLPHEIQINLGASYSLSSFRYLPRQDGPNGRVGQYEFYVSTDGVNWGTAVATGTFPNTAAEQSVAFAATTGRFVRFRALSEVAGQPYTAVAELNVLGAVVTGGPGPISQAGWTLKSVDSEETLGENAPATKAFDGNAATIWHTQWRGSAPPPPHEIQINMGAVVSVTGFRYLPRQDGSTNGRVSLYEFYVSTDGTNWGTAVAAGTFANTAAEKEVTFAAKSGQYVRFRALSDVTGQPYTSMAELNVLGTGGGGTVNRAPDGTIQAPTANVTITAGQSVSFTGVGSDPDGDSLTYLWNFGSGGPPNSTAAAPGAVVFPNAGTYTVTFTVTDSKGTPDPTPATRTITVQGGGGGGTLISQAGWSLRFVDSEETQGANNAATNAFDGNASTYWESQWVTFQPRPPHEIQIDLAATYNVSGFRYLPRQDNQSARVGDYEFYVSTDGVTWGTPVAAGSFRDDNSGGPFDVPFVVKSGRYIRFRALSDVNNREEFATALAELNVFRDGGGNSAPSVTMSAPAQNITLFAGSAVQLLGSGSDPNGPLTYRWSVSPDSGVTDLAATQGVVHFNRAGTFTLRFTVADALGLASEVTRTVTVVAGTPISTAGWAIKFVDSEDTPNGALGPRAIDGNSGTIWHTQWVGAQPQTPHEIQIDLGTSREVTGFRYLPRQDGSSTGNIGGYRFFVSTDGVNWGPPVAIGDFPNSSSIKEAAVVPKTGRYVRLQAVSEVNGLPYTSMAELQVLTRTCMAPSVIISQPKSLYIQPSSTLTLQADVCPSAAGQGVRFTIDRGAATETHADDFTAPYSVTLSGVARGEHAIEAWVIDAAGLAVSGAAYDLAAPVGIGDSYVAIGDGMTYGFGDDRPTDDNSLDGRTMRGGYTSILGNLLTAAKGYPVAVFNEGVQGTASGDGVVSAQAVLQKYPNAQAILVMYGHNDALRGVASGLGLSPGAAGYAGSFKDNYQKIINAAKAAGKTVVLAKAPGVLPYGGSDDAAVQQYNQVVDELAAVAANGITVAPPDFHSFFSTRTTTEYSDEILLNGLGYQSMAQLWRQALLP